MSYERKQVADGVTIMDKELYDNVQDGVEEAKNDIKVIQQDINNINSKFEEMLVLGEV